jgi:putative membrane protein
MKDLAKQFLSDVERTRVNAAVQEAAIAHFFNHGLYRTRDKTGLLVLLSVFERRVWILADRGINAKVPQSEWMIS